MKSISGREFDGLMASGHDVLFGSGLQETVLSACTLQGTSLAVVSDSNLFDTTEPAARTITFVAVRSGEVRGVVVYDPRAISTRGPRWLVNWRREAQRRRSLRLATLLLER